MIYKIDNLTYINLTEVVAIKATSYKSSTRHFCDVDIVFNTGIKKLQLARSLILNFNYYFVHGLS